MEAWYLECLKQWTDRMSRPPCVRELAQWVKRSRTATYAALVSLECKGLVERSNMDGPPRFRRFMAVAR